MHLFNARLQRIVTAAALALWMAACTSPSVKDSHVMVPNAAKARSVVFLFVNEKLAPQGDRSGSPSSPAYDQELARLGQLLARHARAVFGSQGIAVASAQAVQGDKVVSAGVTKGSVDYLLLLRPNHKTSYVRWQQGVPGRTLDDIAFLDAQLIDRQTGRPVWSARVRAEWRGLDTPSAGFDDAYAQELLKTLIAQMKADGMA